MKRMPHLPTNRQKRVTLLLACLAALVVSACATVPKDGTARPAAYAAIDDGSIAARHAPVFVVQRPEIPDNRIGTPQARRSKRGKTKISVNPNVPAIYTQTIPFATAQSRYTNLVYRIHFPGVPYRLRLSHISAGRNTGLLTIVTLNEREQPVLITTVHTCGCYLAFLPTSHLPESAYPESWNTERQKVWGEHLPGLLTLGENAGHIVLTLKNGTHRLAGATVRDISEVETAHGLTRAPLLPMASLESLPLADGTTSLYEESGRRRGLVKGTVKPLETIFVGWWAWDWYVGTDKRYGPASDMRTPFYTSLKPWRRDDSDMWEFPRFLAYWGWGL